MHAGPHGWIPPERKPANNQVTVDPENEIGRVLSRFLPMPCEELVVDRDEDGPHRGAKPFVVMQAQPAEGLSQRREFKGFARIDIGRNREQKVAYFLGGGSVGKFEPRADRDRGGGFARCGPARW